MYMSITHFKNMLLMRRNYIWPFLFRPGIESIPLHARQKSEWGYGYSEIRAMAPLQMIAHHKAAKSTETLKGKGGKHSRKIFRMWLFLHYLRNHTFAYTIVCELMINVGRMSLCQMTIVSKHFCHQLDVETQIPVTLFDSWSAKMFSQQFQGDSAPPPQNLFYSHNDSEKY